MEILRQPMEEHCVKLARLAGNYEFPSDFMLVAAMNPCRCGYYPDLNRCHCTKGMVEQYLKKISQPLLDRIDICVETKRVEYQDLMKENPHQETSAEIRKGWLQLWSGSSKGLLELIFVITVEFRRHY